MTILFYDPSLVHLFLFKVNLMIGLFIKHIISDQPQNF